jgi:serine/threonine protein kinase
MTLERGAILNNRYQIVEILGQGGMGSVYRAVDENLGVEVALKENLFTTEEYARQFRREAVILATLRHPNLTRVTDHFVIEGQGQYLVMDYIEGEDLRQRMDRIGVINEEETVIIGAAICEALSYLHTRIPPIVHRDIKPGNVKITPHGQIYLVDFGLAKVIQTGQATTTGARAMTPGYSPPEQYGTARTDHRSDLFSLGATLYAALCGSIPEDALARAMDQSSLTPLRKRNPRLSRRLAGVIEKSLAVRPDDRYQDAEEFKQALLSVRGISTRRRSGDYSVAPPPDSGDGEISALAEPASNPSAEVYIPRPKNRSPLPLPSSSQLNEPAQPGRRARRRSLWPSLALFAVLLFVAGVAAYTFYPTWPTAALGLISPSGAALAPPAASPTSESPLAATPSLVVVIPPTATPTPTIAFTATTTHTSAPPARATATPMPSPTPTLQPTPLGGGAGEVAFASNRSGTTQIWLSSLDGSGDPFMVTNMPEGACQPDWSPDGQRLVFISPCEQNQDLYPGAGLFIINADGNGLTPLPNVPGGDFDPAWSPDGKSIIFTSLRNTGRPRIYLLTLEDTSVTRLSEPYSYSRHPAWSPDGSQIAYVTTQKGPVQIWTMNPDGSDPQVFSRSGDAINTHPAWALDMEVILFTQVDTTISNIPFIVAATYEGNLYSEVPYDMSPWPVREARYSPDGLWLVFESWPSGNNHDIYVMSSSGAGRTQVTTWSGNDFDADWRPLP